MKIIGKRLKTIMKNCIIPHEISDISLHVNSLQQAGKVLKIFERDLQIRWNYIPPLAQERMRQGETQTYDFYWIGAYSLNWAKMEEDSLTSVWGKKQMINRRRYFFSPLFYKSKYIFSLEQEMSEMEEAPVILIEKDGSIGTKESKYAIRIPSDFIPKPLPSEDRLLDEYAPAIWKALSRNVKRRFECPYDLSFIQSLQPTLQKMLCFCYENHYNEEVEFAACTIFNSLLPSLSNKKESIAIHMSASIDIAYKYFQGKNQPADSFKFFGVNASEQEQNDSELFIMDLLEFRLHFETPDLILRHILAKTKSPFIVTVTSFFFCEAQLLTVIPFHYDPYVIGVSCYILALECLNIGEPKSVLSAIPFRLSSEVEKCKKEIGKEVRVQLIINLSCVIRKYSSPETYAVATRLRHSSVLLKFSQ